MSDFTAYRHDRGLVSRLAAFAVGVAGSIARLVAAEIDRRRVSSLLTLEERELRDIGITRADVYGALLTSAGEKASDHLHRARSDRRRADIAAAREKVARRDRD